MNLRVQDGIPVLKCYTLCHHVCSTCNVMYYNVMLIYTAQRFIIIYTAQRFIIINMRLTQAKLNSLKTCLLGLFITWSHIHRISESILLQLDHQSQSSHMVASLVPVRWASLRKRSAVQRSRRLPAWRSAMVQPDASTSSLIMRSALIY